MKRIIVALITLCAVSVFAADTTTTSNMRLVLPVPGVRAGPAYAQDIVTAFGQVDSHDHTTGKGVRVPVSGLNMNADLALNGYNLTLVRGLRLANQGAAFSAPADVREIYSVNGDLYWNNGGATAVQITSGAGLNAASIGGIGGDYVGSGATVYYTSTPKLYTFDSSSGVRGNMAHGPLYLYDPVSSGKYALVQVPSGLAANYTLTLPTALPASTNPVTLSTAGQLAAAADLTVPGTLTLPAGDVVLSSGSSQYVDKTTGGDLWLRVAGAGGIVLAPGGTGRWSVVAAGNIVSTGVGTVTGLPAPVNSSDSATKGYVDGVSNGKASISWGSGFSDSGSATRLLKQPNGIVILNLVAGGTGSGGATIATLPAGYRPAVTTNAVGWTGGLTGAATVCTISSAGVVTCIASMSVSTLVSVVFWTS